MRMGFSSAAGDCHFEITYKLSRQELPGLVQDEAPTKQVFWTGAGRIISISSEDAVF
jgi:hypothetical protein